MKDYAILVLGMMLIPLIYWGIMMLYRSSFQKEEHRKHIPLHSIQEILVILAAESAFVCIWRTKMLHTIPDILFLMLFVMLAAMTVFCITDYWEQIVPNRILIGLVFLFVLMFGWQGVRDMDVMLGILPSVLLGFLFCMLSFGLGYLLSHKNMGAGDVKLALVMGLYLTGEYVTGAILYGCIAAAVFSCIQLLRKKVSRKDRIPFVPFLYIGLIIRYFMG